MGASICTSKKFNLNAKLPNGKDRVVTFKYSKKENTITLKDGTKLSEQKGIFLSKEGEREILVIPLPYEEDTKKWHKVYISDLRSEHLSILKDLVPKDQEHISDIFWITDFFLFANGKITFTDGRSCKFDELRKVDKDVQPYVYRVKSHNGDVTLHHTIFSNDKPTKGEKGETKMEMDKAISNYCGKEEETFEEFFKRTINTLKYTHVKPDSGEKKVLRNSAAEAAVKIIARREAEKLLPPNGNTLSLTDGDDVSAESGGVERRRLPETGTDMSLGLALGSVLLLGGYLFFRCLRKRRKQIEAPLSKGSIIPLYDETN